MRARLLLRAAVGPLATAALLVAASPALARTSDGEQFGPKLPFLETMLIYVGIPLGLFLVVAAACAAPALLHRPRYRPGRAWTAAPIWFTGPQDPEAALERARPGRTAGGGASARW